MKTSHSDSIHTALVQQELYEQISGFQGLGKWGDREVAVAMKSALRDP